MARKARSRPERWHEAVGAVQTALGELDLSKVEGALEDLDALKDEYEEWYENMPVNQQDGATGEKLQEVIHLDFDCLDSLRTALEEVEEAVGNAEAVDLPLGFGRD
jgi:hypothetical protein